MSLRETNRDTPRIEVRQKTESQAFDSKRCLAITFLFLAIVGVLVGSLGFGRVGELSRLGMLGSGLCLGVPLVAAGVWICVLKKVEADALMRDSAHYHQVVLASTYKERCEDIYSGKRVREHMDTKGFDFTLDDIEATRSLEKPLRDIFYIMDTEADVEMTIKYKKVRSMVYVQHIYPGRSIEIYYFIDCNTKKKYAVMIHESTVKTVISEDLKKLITRMRPLFPSLFELYDLIFRDLKV